MNVVLVSDGPLIDSSNARNIPFFFSTKLYEMSEIASRNLEEAHLLVVELENASGEALANLKDALSRFKDLPKLCIIDKANRKEVVQAAAFGHSEFVERDNELTFLIRKMREMLKPGLALAFPEDAPIKTREAFLQAAACLDEIALRIGHVIAGNLGGQHELFPQIIPYFFMFADDRGVFESRGRHPCEAARCLNKCDSALDELVGLDPGQQTIKIDHDPRGL